MVMTASLSPRPDAEALRLAARRDLVEHRRGLLPPPTERAQVRRGHLAGGREEDEREFTPSRVPRRQALRNLPLPPQQVVRQRSPGSALRDEVRVREDERAMQDGERLVDVLL